MQNKGAIILFTVLLTLASLYQLSFSYFVSKVENEADDIATEKLDSILQVTPNLKLSETDSIETYYSTKYLKDHANEKVYPVLGFTYQECKEKGMNLGLDLAGGMSVVLEVSIPELVQNLSGNSKNVAFVTTMNKSKAMMKDSKDDFITLFDRVWREDYSDLDLWKIFHNRDNKEKFPQNISNKEVIDILRSEAEVAIDNTEKIIRTRIDKFGVAQPNIQKQEYSGRILIELPGVKDKDRVRKQLKSTANLEFWLTSEGKDILPLLQEANIALSTAYFPDAYNDTLNIDTTSASVDSILGDIAENSDSLDTEEDLEALLSESDTADITLGGDQDQFDRETYRKKNPLFNVLNPAVYQDPSTGAIQYLPGAVVGSALVSDTAEVNKYLRNNIVKSLLPTTTKLLWSAKPRVVDEANILDLYAIKINNREGKPALDGSVIVDARQDYDQTGRVEVSMQMNADGARIWKTLTGEHIDEAIAIVLDDYVYSAPNVIGEIPNGRSSISMGRGSSTEQLSEAKDLATLLKAGALPARANIVEESVVGPSLGKENIHDGLMSFVIALVLILFYMFFYYNGAGIVSDIALVANLFFLLGALASLQAALTLPGIAGIVLTGG
jgi:SecD/SecF fusion protein